MQSITPAKIATIPASAHFMESLAAGLLREVAEQPEALRQYEIYLPNRRAVRNLSQAFFRVAQRPRALILPRMKLLASGSDDEIDQFGGDPGTPVIPVSQLQRALIFAKRIHQILGKEQGFSHSLSLAIALGRLRDELLNSELPPERLVELVPVELAEHWQASLQILLPVLTEWEAELSAEAGVEQVTARNQYLQRQIAEWQRSPAPHPVVMAGLIPPPGGLSDFLAAILTLPTGRLVFPAVDLELLSQTPTPTLAPTHPQAMIAALFNRLGIEAAAVAPWPAELLRGHSAEQAERIDGFARVLRDAAPRPGLANLRLRRFDCLDISGEAEIIALHLREAIELSEQTTAALVTRDRNLARLVKVELERLGLGVDDSGGIPLLKTPPGIFMILLLRAVSVDVSPSELLALLKHPLMRAGMERTEFLERLRQLEKFLLRGTRPGRGQSGIRNAFKGEIRGLSPAQKTRLEDWYQRIERLLEPLVAEVNRDDSTMAAAVAQWIRTADALAADRSGDSSELWRDEAGDCLARFCGEVAAASATVGRLDGRSLADSIEQLAAGITVYKLHPSHRRVFIWGPAEARLNPCDRMILGGLNEGSWPNTLTTDPWLSQPMRERLGLETHDQQIGASAHDFLGCFGAPEVILTRSTTALLEVKEPSRWLRLLDRENPTWPGAERLGWIGRRDQPSGPADPAQFEPRPCPPLSARRRDFSPSAIRLWYRNPYGYYARYILSLYALDPLDAAPDHRERGQIFHQIIADFIEHYPATLPPDAEARLAAIAKADFDEIRYSHPEIAVFWEARFASIAAFILRTEAERRPELVGIFSEIQGSIELETAKGSFRLTAKADRIETRRDGSVRIVDYKTGSAPASAKVIRGFEPQLLLEAMIARRHHGFPAIPAAHTISLEYWEIKGGEGDKNRIRPIPSDKQQKTLSVAAAIDEAERGLVRLFEKFWDESTAYRVRPHRQEDYKNDYDDYEHLARQDEWGVTE
ncbi:MAG: double-strand break repair protein AddB [Alphaproteobacteria bacterium]|nr:double-strand break repair protein AddB [Alphaproteobacteria bacterium]